MMMSHHQLYAMHGGAPSIIPPSLLVQPPAHQIMSAPPISTALMGNLGNLGNHLGNLGNLGGHHHHGGGGTGGVGGHHMPPHHAHSHSSHHLGGGGSGHHHGGQSIGNSAAAAAVSPAAYVQPENREHDEYEFREMFKVIVPGNLRVKMKLSAALLDSPIGRLVVIADDVQIYLLQCLNRSKIKEKVQRLAEITHSQITAEPYKTKAMLMLEHELMQYFNGRLEVFRTPIKMIGTDFQLQVWGELRRIPFGQQISYGKLAVAINRETSASRSVAQAVGSNKLLILVPCHRVINESGKVGGFNCGLDRKQLLLTLEGFRG